MLPAGEIPAPERGMSRPTGNRALGSWRQRHELSVGTSDERAVTQVKRLSLVMIVTRRPTESYLAGRQPSGTSHIEWTRSSRDQADKAGLAQNKAAKRNMIACGLCLGYVRTWGNDRCGSDSARGSRRNETRPLSLIRALRVNSGTLKQKDR